MTIFATLHRHLPVSSRLLALGLAAVVFGLSALVHAPSAHQHLHADAHEAEHSCAIDLFAQGLTAAAAAVFLATLHLRAVHAAWCAPVLRLAVPARLRPPGRGPPAS